MKKRALLLLFLFINIGINCFSEAIQIGNTGAELYLIEQWTQIDHNDSTYYFSSPDNSLRTQLSYFKSTYFKSLKEMERFFLLSLKDTIAERSVFNYGEYNASLWDITFTSESKRLRGWFLFLKGGDYDFYLTTITGASLYEGRLNFILSTLDSFLPSSSFITTPGVISHFFALGDESREEASQAVIEREAAIMTSYTNVKELNEGWKRYYRLVYKDSFSDILPISQKFHDQWQKESKNSQAQKILSELQSYTYGSIDRFSDLLSPMSCYYQRKGDCDSLALLYSIILKQLGIDSVFMISREYHHAMLALDLPIKGAKVYYNEKPFVVAELTRSVNLGLIDQSMTDTSKWTIFNLEY